MSSKKINMDQCYTQREEQEIRNKNLIVRYGASNVAFLDNSWGDGLLDYHACMSMMR